MFLFLGFCDIFRGGGDEESNKAFLGGYSVPVTPVQKPLTQMTLLLHLNPALLNFHIKPIQTSAYLFGFHTDQGAGEQASICASPEHSLFLVCPAQYPALA